MNAQSAQYRYSGSAAADQRAAVQFVLDCFSPGVSSEQLSQAAATANWALVMQYAGDQLVSPSMFMALRGRGILPSLGEEAIAALEMILQANRLRNEVMLKACRRMASTLDACGVSWLPLKGMALLSSGVYPDVGERMLSDIDIYIPEAEIPQALRALRDAGYCQISNVNDPVSLFAEHGFVEIDLQDHRNAVRSVGYQLPVILDSELDVFFELHHRIVAADTDMGRWLNKSAARLSATARSAATEGTLYGFDFHLLHNLYHSQIKDACYYTGHLDLRHLLDVTRMIDQVALNTGCDLRPQLVIARSLGTGPEFNCFVQTAKELMGAKISLWDDISEQERAGRARFERLRSNPRAGRAGRWRINLTRYRTYLLSREWLAQFYGDMPMHRYPYRLARYFVNKVYLWVRR